MASRKLKKNQPVENANGPVPENQSVFQSLGQSFGQPAAPGLAPVQEEEQEIDFRPGSWRTMTSAEKADSLLKWKDQLREEEEEKKKRAEKRLKKLAEVAKEQPPSGIVHIVDAAGNPKVEINKTTPIQVYRIWGSIKNLVSSNQKLLATATSALIGGALTIPIPGVQSSAIGLAADAAGTAMSAAVVAAPYVSAAFTTAVQTIGNNLPEITLLASSAMFFNNITLQDIREKARILLEESLADFNTSNKTNITDALNLIDAATAKEEGAQAAETMFSRAEGFAEKVFELTMQKLTPIFAGGKEPNADEVAEALHDATEETISSIEVEDATIRSNQSYISFSSQMTSANISQQMGNGEDGMNAIGAALLLLSQNQEQLKESLDSSPMPSVVNASTQEPVSQLTQTQTFNNENENENEVEEPVSQVNVQESLMESATQGEQGASKKARIGEHLTTTITITTDAPISITSAGEQGVNPSGGSKKRHYNKKNKTRKYSKTRKHF